MFPSGKWRGFWEAAGWGRRWMEPLTLHFEGGRIEGDGLDCIGWFTFGGAYSDDGSVHMLKQYVGKHSVIYEGRVSGEGAVVGRWSIPPLASGPFAMMPVVDVEDLPIATMVAANPA